jgi:hypothetical protein
MPQPIETAPKDGTVILTDCGFARYNEHFIHYKGLFKVDPDAKRGAWLECNAHGYIYDDDHWCECEPKFWEPRPEWVAGDE